MTTRELGKRLYKINHYLTIIMKEGKPLKIVYLSFHNNHDIYDFETNKYNLANCKKYIPDEMKDVADLIDEYKYPDMFDSLHDQVKEILDDKISPLTIGQSDNPFKKYTDHLAVTLENKNKDYGDSFSRSVDKFGIIAAVVRLEDKFNRLENLTANGGKEKVKDESLADTALDISGYGLLLYKYLKERERTSK